MNLCKKCAHDTKKGCPKVTKMAYKRAQKIGKCPFFEKAKSKTKKKKSKSKKGTKKSKSKKK